MWQWSFQSYAFFPNVGVLTTSGSVEDQESRAGGNKTEMCLGPVDA